MKDTAMGADVAATIIAGTMSMRVDVAADTGITTIMRMRWMKMGMAGAVADIMDTIIMIMITTMGMRKRRISRFSIWRGAIR